MLQGMTMTCPPGWRDGSMLILSAPAPGASGVTANMVVTRDRMPAELPTEPGARMSALVDLQVARMRDQLAGFQEVSRRVAADGAPSAELRVNWSSAQAPVTQSLTFVETGENGLMIATATTGRGEHEEHEATFRDMLRSFRLAS